MDLVYGLLYFMRILFAFMEPLYLSDNETKHHQDNELLKMVYLVFDKKLGTTSKS